MPPHSACPTVKCGSPLSAFFCSSASAMSLLIPRASPQVSPAFSEPMNHLESEMHWTNLPNTQQAPLGSAPHVHHCRQQCRGGSAGCLCAPTPPWPRAMVGVSTHQISFKVKPQDAGLQSHCWQGVQQDKLCQNLHISKHAREDTASPQPFCSLWDWLSRVHQRKSVKSRGQERLKSDCELSQVINKARGRFKDYDLAVFMESQNALVGRDFKRWSSSSPSTMGRDTLYFNKVMYDLIHI